MMEPIVVVFALIVFGMVIAFLLRKKKPKKPPTYRLPDIHTTTNQDGTYTWNITKATTTTYNVKKKVRATKFDKRVYYFRDLLWHPFDPAIDGHNVKLVFDPKVEVEEEPTHTIREQYNEEAVRDKGIIFKEDD
jgi:hypothetical protein